MTLLQEAAAQPLSLALCWLLLPIPPAVSGLQVLQFVSTRALCPLTPMFLTLVFDAMQAASSTLEDTR